MVVLAIETVTRAGSLALWDGSVCHARAGEPVRTHAERLPGELIDWLAVHGRTLADVGLLVVVTGPGSFTGMRIGLAAVQGLALAAHKRVRGVPTLQALAGAWQLSHPAPALVAACLDGQRGEVFVAGYRVDGVSLVDATAEVLPAMVGTPEIVAGRIEQVAAAQHVVLVGDGAERYRSVFKARLPAAEIVAAPMTLAEAAVRIAVLRPDLAGPPHALRPVYVRRPDAELARERAGIPVTPAPLDLVVRKAETSEDLKAVEHLQQQTFTNPWGIDAIRWELENTDVARLYVARDPQQALVAYCACWVIFDELHINSFAVDPAWRRRGCARVLLHSVLAEAAGQGARSATLEVRESNLPARKLYEGLGFRVEGVRRDYYQDPREDALILWNRSLC